VSDRALAFVNQHKAQPFFLYVAYIASHFNIAAPADEVDRHNGKLSEADPTRPLNATYAAMVTRLDHEIGRLVEMLDRLGLSQNSLIVFTSDQGATFERGNQGTSVALDSNGPLRGQKRTLWEGGIRVPGLARWPGRIPADTVCSEPVHLIDLMPTLVAAAGGAIDPSWNVDGIDVLPILTGQRRGAERTIFWEWQSEGYDQLAAIRGNDKLVVTRGGKPELYDVVADPAERRDLSAIRPALTRRLHEELKGWLRTEVGRNGQ
jgi:arylsulfatase A-like enzyme